MEIYIIKLVEEVGRRDSDFCSKNYLQPICAEVSDILEKVRNWNKEVHTRLYIEGVTCADAVDEDMNKSSSTARGY